MANFKIIRSKKSIAKLNNDRSFEGLLKKQGLAKKPEKPTKTKA
tara:strand:- start:928 stop:1059 length:132 start_codon:yes stop_codon:yes gene_type:complete